MTDFATTKKYILELLNKASAEEKSIQSFFIHGSFVTGTTSKQAYRDERYYLHNKYLFSVIKRVDASYDVDCIAISSDPEATKNYFNDLAFNFDGIFLTINVITKDTFTNELLRAGTNAIRRILLFKTIDILKGEDIILEGKQALKSISQQDYLENESYQQEFSTKKKLLTIIGEQGINEIRIDKDFFSQFCPIITKEISEGTNTGFPMNRTKVVLPKPMYLKARIDMDTLSTRNLE